MAEIELIIGCMFSGKTAELIKRLRREQVCGHKIQLFKPKLDDRYKKETVVSHDKDSLVAIPVISTTEIYKHLEEDTAVIGIDEVQFFDDKIIDFCLEQANCRKIIISGLNLDFRGEPFSFIDSEKTIWDLAPHAFITQQKAVCTYSDEKGVCKKEANFTQRLIDGKPASYDSPLILVGAKESYEARCKEHFVAPKKI